MSTTTTFAGQHASSPAFRLTQAGDLGGGDTAQDPVTTLWDADGGTAPTGSQFFKGELSITGAQDILLAHATDPLQGAGAASLCRGWGPSGLLKLKYLRLRITSGANLTVARKAANGLPIFAAAGDGLVFGNLFEWTDHDGDVTGVVTSGGNDGLTLTPSTGTVVATVMAVFGL